MLRAAHKVYLNSFDLIDHKKLKKIIFNLAISAILRALFAKLIKKL